MDDKTKPARFSNSSLRGLISDSGYKLYIQRSAQKSLDSFPQHLKLQTEKNIQSLAAIPRPRSVGRLAFQMESGSHFLLTNSAIIEYWISPGSITILAIGEVKSVTPLNRDSTEAQQIAECMGRCHGVPNRQDWRPMTQDETAALTSTMLSSIGAVTAGLACKRTRLSCGLAVVLAGDAVRQFSIGGRNVDPVVKIAVKAGADENQAEQIAAGATYMTAVISIHGAYKGVLMHSTSAFSAGTLGALYLDGFSTVHTIRELNRSSGAGQ